MLGQRGSVHVEAGVVAGQWEPPLRLCLHCCPLVNDWAVGSWSFVYAVIKHSKPPGWQQAHSLAPGHSMENKTHLTLCFPAPQDPTSEQNKSVKGAVSVLSNKDTSACTFSLAEGNFLQVMFPVWEKLSLSLFKGILFEG